MRLYLKVKAENDETAQMPINAWPIREETNTVAYTATKYIQDAENKITMRTQNSIKRIGNARKQNKRDRKTIKTRNAHT